MKNRRSFWPAAMIRSTCERRSSAAAGIERQVAARRLKLQRGARQRLQDAVVQVTARREDRDDGSMEACSKCRPIQAEEPAAETCRAICGHVLRGFVGVCCALYRTQRVRRKPSGSKGYDFRPLSRW